MYTLRIEAAANSLCCATGELTIAHNGQQADSCSISRADPMIYDRFAFELINSLTRKVAPKSNVITVRREIALRRLIDEALASLLLLSGSSTLSLRIEMQRDLLHSSKKAQVNIGNCRRVIEPGKRARSSARGIGIGLGQRVCVCIRFSVSLNRGVYRMFAQKGELGSFSALCLIHSSAF